QSSREKNISFFSDIYISPAPVAPVIVFITLARMAEICSLPGSFASALSSACNAAAIFFWATQRLNSSSGSAGGCEVDSVAVASGLVLLAGSMSFGFVVKERWSSGAMTGALTLGCLAAKALSSTDLGMSVLSVNCKTIGVPTGNLIDLPFCTIGSSTERP